MRSFAVERMIEHGVAVDSNHANIFPKTTEVQIGVGSRGKIETISKYKYNICCENSLADGYTTEKCFEALAAGCIAVYFGNKSVEPKVLYGDNIVHIEDVNMSIQKKTFDISKVWKPDALVHIYSVYNKIWAIVAKKLELSSRKKLDDVVTYACKNVEECIEKQSQHWKQYNHFFTPKAEFVMNGKILWAEDFADELYEKYNLTL